MVFNRFNDQFNPLVSLFNRFNKIFKTIALLKYNFEPSKLKKNYIFFQYNFLRPVLCEIFILNNFHINYKIKHLGIKDISCIHLIYYTIEIRELQ